MPDSERGRLRDGTPAWSVLIIAGSLAIGSIVATGASHQARALYGVAVPWVCLIVAFSVQWIAFVPAYLRQTEHFYDLIGSATYLALVALSSPSDLRGLLLGAMISIWAVRLGTFLFRRVRNAGSDRRFDEIKRSAPRFLVAWTLQGLWVFLTLSAAIAAMSSIDPRPLGLLDGVGAAVWCVGFGIEVVADRQKSRFRAENQHGFIRSGLWSWSRHPNYFGEIVLWTGIAIIAMSTLREWQWVTIISPIFVALLLTKVSGVPPLEEQADARWGADPAYLAYRAQTSVLIPMPPGPKR
jgi:steroid 5-alpha reductase family enzyme